MKSGRCRKKSSTTLSAHVNLHWKLVQLNFFLGRDNFQTYVTAKRNLH